ncbi:MAG: hypothetical protein ACYC91_18570 [Solirubrobacteraceae bacterium]
MRIASHGRSIDVPEGWEARILRHSGGAPVLHVASFALTDRDGDFGAAATGRMRPDDVFAALVEYRVDAKIRPGRGLFSPPPPRPPRAHELSSNQLQVTRRGQIGWQRFFTDADRPCCLYIVVQPGRMHPDRLVKQLGDVLATLRFHGG